MMFRHYLRTSLSVLSRRKLFAVLNIGGLAIGLTCCFLIGLYIQDELGFDADIPGGDRLYRVSSNALEESARVVGGNAATTPLVASLLAADFAQVELSARLYAEQGLLKHDEVAFYEREVRFVDPGFFELFPFAWLEGDAGMALNEPFTIVLTESLARKYFGSTEPVGKLLRFENAFDLRVTGVIRDLSHNTHLQASAFASLDSLARTRGESFLDNWSLTAFHTYVRVAPGTNVDDLQALFPAFLDRHYNAAASKSVGLALMHVRDIHLHSTRPFELSPPGSLGRIYVFSAIALCILLVASINFMNLCLAGAAQRSREIGLRKVVGANGGQIIRQLLMETLIITLLAALAGLMLVELLLPAFNQFTGKVLSLTRVDDFSVVAVAAVIGGVLLSGIYPAWYQSAFKPAAILNGVVSMGRQAGLVRNAVIVLQFGIAIVLIAGTIVIYRQLQYTDEIEQGFDDERVLILSGSVSQGLYRHWPVLRDRLLALDGVVNAAASNLVPHEENGNTITVWAEGDPDGRRMAFLLIDHGYFATYGIPLLEGRLFSEAVVTDTVVLPDEANPAPAANVILNRAAVLGYGWSPESAIGKTYDIFHQGRFVKGRVIGVVEDSIFESLHKPIQPLVFLVPQGATWKGIPSFQQISVKVAGEQLEHTIDSIEAAWKETIPEFPLRLRFLDESRHEQYRTEETQAELVGIFTGLSLFIAAVGLFALASYNAQRRTKEIGVRKVMGGSVWSIVVLLTNDFSRLVLLSNLIAWPVAYFAMERWLQNFAYRIDLTPLVFIGSGLIALCIAWVTVGGTAAKAASAKPVLALRCE